MQIIRNAKISPRTDLKSRETVPIEQAKFITSFEELPKNGNIVYEDQRNIKKGLACEQSKALVINPL